MIRCFLAVEVAPEIHAALVELKRTLAAGDASVAWVRDENLHATVKFLGGVADADLPALRAALAAAVRTRPHLRAEVAGVGVFPNPRRPRVVWAGLRCPALADVAAAVDRALAPLGFAPEARAFRAHVTLGRVRDPRGGRRLERALRPHREHDFGACTIAELVAFRSDLRRDGAVYTKLWAIPFGG